MTTLKIVVVGDGAIGKTSMLISYSTNTFSTDYSPTVFDNYTVNTMVGDKIYNISLWDTAGQEDYDRLRPLSYTHTDLFLICYSITNQYSFSNVKNKWLPEISKHSPNTPKILVGLKNDMRNDPSITTFVAEKDAIKFAKDNGFSGHYLCSALTQEGLKEMFDKAIQVCIKKQKDDISDFSGNKCCIIS